MPSFYHGTSALFDNFDDSKIGKNTAVGNCENGRGTYLSSDLDWASEWQERFDGAFYHTKRIDISDAAWEKKISFPKIMFSHGRKPHNWPPMPQTAAC